MYTKSDNRQIYDSLRRPVYNTSNGLPICVNSVNQITTITGETQSLGQYSTPSTIGGVSTATRILQNVSSVGHLIQSGKGYYIAETKPVYGAYDIIVLNQGTDKSPIWVLPNNTSALAYIQSLTIGGNEKNWLKEHWKTLLIILIVLAGSTVIGVTIYRYKSRIEPISQMPNQCPPTNFRVSRNTDATFTTPALTSYCMQCGKPSNINAKFCPFCGNPKNSSTV